VKILYDIWQRVRLTGRRKQEIVVIGHAGDHRFAVICLIRYKSPIPVGHNLCLEKIFSREFN
jgi:hypothetical protein